MPNGHDFHFVTGGIEAALELVRRPAPGNNLFPYAGPYPSQQYLAAGLLDEIQLHVPPVRLGDGVRLFAAGGPAGKLEIDRVIASPAVTHLRYRVVK